MINIKKFFLVTMSLILILAITGCSRATNGNKANIGSDKRVVEAIETITEFWENDYVKNKIEDRYLKIINTRVINIKNNINSEEIFNKDDLFENVDYIVEFELLSNYFDTAPYYSNVGTNNCVIVYKDGTAMVQRNPLLLYRSATYSNDFSSIIESIEDFDEQYNHIIKFE